jgi:hydrogenase expression/formation protein HypD
VRVVRQLEDGRAEVENQYARTVRPEGNPAARAVVERVYEVADLAWRGIGVVPGGGLRLRPAYARLDAATRLGLEVGAIAEPTECRAADVLQGRITPAGCPEFGTRCTPDRPLGAPMVSSEGACAAWWRYRRHRLPARVDP